MLVVKDVHGAAKHKSDLQFLVFVSVLFGFPSLPLLVLTLN